VFLDESRASPPVARGIANLWPFFCFVKPFNYSNRIADKVPDKPLLQAAAKHTNCAQAEGIPAWEGFIAFAA
jgi:hypothetical protein